MNDATKLIMDEAEKLLEEGIKYHREHEYDLAFDFLNKAVELREKARNSGYVDNIYDDYTWEYSEYYFFRARGYRGKKDYDSAIADYTKSIELGGGSYGLRANIYFYHKKDYDSAIADFTKAVEWCGRRGCKQCADLLYMRGRAYLAKGDYYNGVKSFRMALKQWLLYILVASRYKCKMLIRKIRNLKKNSENI